MNFIPGIGILGFGFNVLGRNSSDSATLSLIDLGSSTTPITVGSASFDVPSNVSVNTQSSASIDQQVFASQSEFATHLSASYSISEDATFFSGEFDFAFDFDYESNNQNYYCMTQDKRTCWSLNVKSPTLTKEFTADVQALANSDGTYAFTEQNQKNYFAFLDKWGTHYVNQVSMGARLDFYITAKQSAATTKANAQMNMELEFDALFSDTQESAHAKWNMLSSTWSASRTVKIHTLGGSITGLDIDYAVGDNRNQLYTAWQNTFSQNPYPISYKLSELSALFSGDQANAIDAAIHKYTHAMITVEGSMSDAQDSLAYYSAIFSDDGVIGPENPGDPEGQVIISQPFWNSKDVPGGPWPVSKYPPMRFHVALLEPETANEIYSHIYYFPDMEDPSKVLSTYQQISDDLSDYTDPSNNKKYIAVIAWVGIYCWIFPDPIAPWLSYLGVDMNLFREVSTDYSAKYNFGLMGIIGNNTYDKGLVSPYSVSSSGCRFWQIVNNNWQGADSVSFKLQKLAFPKHDYYYLPSN